MYVCPYRTYSGFSKPCLQNICLTARQYLNLNSDQRIMRDPAATKAVSLETLSTTGSHPWLGSLSRICRRCAESFAQLELHLVLDMEVSMWNSLVAGTPMQNVLNAKDINAVLRRRKTANSFGRTENRLLGAVLCRIFVMSLF
jgi:hypothetical protein